jgi:hypothetical protein
VGVGVVVLGVVVLVVALFALREPKGHVSSATGTQRIRTVLSTVTNTPRASSSTASSTAPSSATTSSRSPSPKTSSSTATGVKAVPLIVLNNTSIPDLARNAAQKLRSDGWTVTNFDSFSNNIISTCAYFDPSVAGARAAADALRNQYPWIKRAKARFPELPSGPVVVVLTRDFSTG